VHTVELLEEALAVARQLGYGIRQEWLGGGGGGGCEIRGSKWLFLDLAVDTDDQLEQALDALRHDPAIRSVALSPELSRTLGLRRAA
jgi:hypothetical protein